MNAAPEVRHDLTAADVMNRDLVVVPQQMLVREAVRLLHRARAGAAPVVDEHGRCAGIFSPADVFRWVEAGCPEVAVGPAHTCPYRIRGRLLTGQEAVICTLAHGGCPFQSMQPTTGGGHVELCIRPEGVEPPPGTVTRYMTADVLTARPQTPLPDLARQIGDAHADWVVVVDEADRPIGIVSAPDILNAVAGGCPRGRSD